MKKQLKRKSSVSTVSVIVSVYNFAEVIETLYARIRDSLRSVSNPVEIVFVDDASTDGTAERIGMLTRKDKRLKCIRMRSSFGEAAALDAGLKESTGEWIVFLSGRVNLNPAAIPGLIRSVQNGKDLVMGRRFPRRDSFLNRLISTFFNWMVARIYKVRLHDINSGIFSTRRSVLERVSFYGDLFNFIPILAAQQGYRIGEEDIEQLPGSFRNSKYPKEYVQRMLDMVTVFFLARYSKKPIHFLGFVGTLFILLGLAILVYLFFYRILQMGSIAGRPLLVLGALLLVIGVQMISIGLLGEMIIFTHAGEIEEYNIQEVIGGRLP